MFIPLHINTSYSFLQSGLTVETVCEQFNKVGYKVGAISDLNVLFGLPSFNSVTRQNGIRPLFGMDIRLQGELITLLIQNEVGYRNLIHISTLISENLLTTDQLLKHNEGLIAVLSTAQGNLPTLSASDKNQIPAYLKSFNDLFSTFYLGIENYGKYSDQNFLKFIRQFALDYSYDFVAFPFIQYAEENDAIILKIVTAINQGSTLEQTQEKGPYYLYTLEEINELYTQDEINNSLLLANSLDFKFLAPRGELMVYPDTVNSLNTLREMAIDGLQKRVVDFSNLEYLTRLNQEISVIHEMGFVDYFLIVADFIKYARQQNILVGPGRGSAPGSLVSYALMITDLDPIKHNLLFERFLNNQRVTMPDIDIDFEDLRREEIVNYLREKYGIERVANIITFQTIQAKQAIRDIGRVYQFSQINIEALIKALPDSRRNLKESYRTFSVFRNLVKNDKECLEIIRLANKIEGLIRQSGMHAAGIILNNTSLLDVLPLLKVNGFYITQYEMNYLEEQHFLKIDLLALRNLTIIHRCVDLINKNHPTSLDPFHLPYDDEKIFSLISSGHTMGIFQLESDGMRNAIMEIQPSSFQDIVVLLAIFRPGPMDNIQSYSRRKKGLENYSIDPILTDILAPTYGIIIYQEQIMQIVQKMAGYSLEEADNFRRAMSKKDADKMLGLQKDFIQSAVRQGYSEGHALTIFGHINKFAEYGFNKSHSAAYAVISCQMAYLKTYYPLEFYSTILGTTNARNDEKFGRYLEELKGIKVNLLAPNINLSTKIYSISQHQLIYPLSGIAGISDDLANRIIRERLKAPFLDFFNFVDRMYQYNILPKQVENLIDAGAFDSLHPNRESLRLSVSIAFKSAAFRGDEYENGILQPSTLANPKLEVGKEDSKIKLENEERVLGIVLSDSPFKVKERLLRHYQYLPIIQAHLQKDSFQIAGLIKRIKVIKTKQDQVMAFMTIFDDSGQIDAVLFPSLYESYGLKLETGLLLLLKGKYDGTRKASFIIEELTIIEDKM